MQSGPGEYDDYEIKVRTVGGRLSRLLVIAIAVVLALGVVGVLSSSLFVTLRQGEVAVTVDPLTGGISKPIVGPAFLVKAPWQYVIKDFYTIDLIDMISEGETDYPPVVVLTKDGVEVTIDVSFTYRVNPDRFNVIVMNYPRVDYEEQRLVPVMRQTVRDVAAKYTVEELITYRDRVVEEIDKEFRSRIASDPTLEAIEIHEVNLRNINLPDRIKTAIEEKIAKLQEKIAAEFERDRVLTLANATAQKSILEAEGEARALLIRIESLKMALNELYNVTRDPEILRIYLYLEELQRLQQGNILLILGGQQPLLTLPLPVNSTTQTGPG